LVLAGLILVKLGGSVITFKDRPFKANYEVIDRLSMELSEAYASFNGALIVAHGGGSFPHPIAAKYGVHEGLKEGVNHRGSVLGYALTQDAASSLNRVIVSSLLRHGVPAVSLQPSAFLIARRRVIVSSFLEPVKALLKHRLIPVPFGDAVMDEELGFTIISTERIIRHLAVKLGASKVIVCTDVDGVYDKDPKRYADAKLIRKVCSSNLPNILESMTPSTSPDVTGGMLHKVVELYELAKLGVESEVINALKPGLLKQALMGIRGLGTTITA